MKQTIAELGIGGEGWIIYDDYILPNLPKRVTHIDVVNNWDRGKYIIPRYLLREHIESNGVQTTRDLIVFGNEIVYSTKEEAEDELQKQVCKNIHMEKRYKSQIKETNNIDWKQVRINAAISVLNALLETTKHSVLEELAVNDIFAKAAVGYADKLVYELKRSEALFEEKLKEV